LSSAIQPRRIAIGEFLGSFRHTYRSWLDETWAPMKVQQELMRHASILTTMNVYGRIANPSISPG
jgi:integrase